MLSLLIASPYPALRAGLRVLLEEAGPATITIVGEADSVEACLDAVRTSPPQVVVFDLALETDDEMSGLWRLRRSFALEVAVLALSESNADVRVLAALQAGARGCLPKTATGVELLDAVQRVVAGGTILHPATTTALLEQLRGENSHDSLTPRESEVLRYVAAGQTNKAIALKLGISEHTIKFHLSSAMSKLGAASRAEAVAIAIRRGLISV